jgi:hypothetical protein
MVNYLLVVGKPSGFNWCANAFGLTEDHPPHAWTTGYESKMPSEDNTGKKVFVRVGQTSDNAKYLGEDYENTLLAFGETFARENVYGSLVHTQGSIFPSWSTSMHVIPNECADMMWQQQVIKRACGGDYGDTNPAAWLVTGMTGEGDMLCIDEWYEARQRTASICYNGARLRRKWAGRKSMSFPYDSANSGIIRELNGGCTWMGETERVNAIKADKDFAQSIGKMRDLMEFRQDKAHPFKVNERGLPVYGAPKFYVAERCVNFREELSKYREKNELGSEPVAENASGHDHLIDCCRYAAMDLFGRISYAFSKVSI